MEKKLFRSCLLLIAFAVLLVLLVIKFDVVMHGAGIVVGLLKPFFIGFAIAFVLNIPYVAIYNGLCRFHKTRHKWNQRLAVVAAYLLCFGILGGVIAIVIPELGKSINMLVSNSAVYRENFQNALVWLGQFDLSPLTNLDWEQLFADLEQELKALLGQAMDMMKVLFPQIFDVTSNVIHGVMNLFIGLIISVYLLLSKDTLCRQVKRMTYAFLPKSIADECVDVCRLSSQCFNNFISGQLMEACILGLLCFIGMTIFRFEYAFLISLMIGSTAIVPIVGAFIGTVPAVFLLFLVDPMDAVWFLVFILTLQQIEGHLIYPKVVGESVGLPALWVMLGILVGGGLGGVLGMLLGVPMVTVAYKLLGQLTQKRLEQKKLEL